MEGCQIAEVQFSKGRTVADMAAGRIDTGNGVAVGALVGKGAPAIPGEMNLVGAHGSICYGLVAMQVCWRRRIGAVAMAEVASFRTIGLLMAGEAILCQAPVTGIVRTVAALAG